MFNKTIMNDDRSVHYKILVFVDSHKWSKKEGQKKQIGNWEEHPNHNFKTIIEAEEWIKETYDMNNFKYITINGYDELQGSKIDKIIDNDTIENYSIIIEKHIIDYAKFKTLQGECK